jgi:hypothetical protein
MNPKKFPLFLIELEFRYNHHHHDIYEDLVKCIAVLSGGFYSVITHNF